MVMALLVVLWRINVDAGVQSGFKVFLCLLNLRLFPFHVCLRFSYLGRNLSNNPPAKAGAIEFVSRLKRLERTLTRPRGSADALRRRISAIGRGALVADPPAPGAGFSGERPLRRVPRGHEVVSFPNVSASPVAARRRPYPGNHHRRGC